METDDVLLLMVSSVREFPLLPGLEGVCFLILDVVFACLLIELPIPRLLLELIRLFRLAAGCCAAFGGGVLFGLITLPIREFARSIELIRLFELPAGCFTTLEEGVISGLFTLSMSDLLRLVELTVDCFLVLDAEVVCLPITLPILQPLLELIRLFELAAGCSATVGGGVLSAPNTLPIRELIRFVELLVG